MSKQKYRRLGEDEIIQKGDIYHTQNFPDLVIDGWEGEKVKMIVDADNEYVERPLPAKTKKPGLAKLVKRLSAGQYIVIHPNGYAEIHPRMYQIPDTDFDTIAKLKAHLTMLPEQETK